MPKYNPFTASSIETEIRLDVSDIPQMTATAMISMLLTEYVPLVEKGLPFSMFNTPFLWGATGVGKSTLVHTFADELGRKVGRKVSVKTVFLSLLTPNDLMGLPLPNEERDAVTWSKPEMFAEICAASSDELWILFLDEMTCASRDTQAAAQQLVYEYGIGCHRLPDNVLIICAGNRADDQGVVYKMPGPLRNRLSHFEVVSEFNAWMRWAEASDIHPDVISFLKAAGHHLQHEPQSKENAFPTPRTWERVSNLLKVTGHRPEALRSAIAALIGSATAEEFIRSRQMSDLLPSAEQIVNGTVLTVPRQHDVLLSLCNNIISYIRSLANSIDPQRVLDHATARKLSNLFGYVNNLPPDFCGMILDDVIHNKKAYMMCSKVLSFEAMCHKFTKG